MVAFGNGFIYDLDDDMMGCRLERKRRVYQSWVICLFDYLLDWVGSRSLSGFEIKPANILLLLCWTISSLDHPLPWLMFLIASPLN